MFYSLVRLFFECPRNSSDRQNAVSQAFTQLFAVFSAPLSDNPCRIVVYMVKVEYIIIRKQIYIL